MPNSPTKFKRPPVVVVMGHVDHGKTTLLDYIRKSNVASREAGGITQGVGAYEITHPVKSATTGQATGERITFIDTPGHEAFTKMRSRGALIADIAILVVAADDGVNVQTKEAIKIIQDAKIPYVVAINKIDKNNADVERAKTDLMKAGVLIEGYGGNISVQPISAKTGENVNELLDLILLTAEVEELTYEPKATGSGIILEAKMDSRSGVLITAIIKNGTLRAGDTIQAGQVVGKIKGLKNFLGEPVKELTACSSAVILGFETLPKIGDEFVSGSSVTEVVELAKVFSVRKPVTAIGAPEAGKINFILKANLSGSLEALTEAIRKIKAPGGKVINIVAESVGDVTDGDANMASTTGATIIAFKVKVLPQAQTIIRTFGIKLNESEIIYELLDAIIDDMTGRRKLIAVGDLEVLAVFDQKNKVAQVIGGKVVEGEIKNQSIIEIHRRGSLQGTGKITNLQQNRKDAQTVIAGLECGLLVSSDIPVAKGDHLIIRSL
jgi:translation initiation factor IF-2